MKKIISSLAVICLLTASLISCSSSTEKKQDGTTTPTQQAIYQCPMQCEGDKTYDKAGKCPVCGMDLKQVEAVVPVAPDSMHTTGDSVEAV